MSLVNTIITNKKGRAHNPENDYEIKLEPVYINGCRKITRKNKKVKYAIYKLTDLITNKVYIGATTIEPTERWQSGYGYHTNLELYSAINKCGWKNIKKEVIAYAINIEQCAFIEKYFIEKYKSYDLNYGFNLTRGGDNLKNHTDIIRQRMSKSHTGLKESINTKKKKSNKVIAFKDDILYVCDSGKLLGDFDNGTSKDYVKNCLRKPCLLHGFNVYYFSKEKRNNIISKKLQNAYSKGKKYIEFCKFLDEVCDEHTGIIITDKYTVKYLIYSNDSENGYELVDSIE